MLFMDKKRLYGNQEVKYRHESKYYYYGLS